MVGSFLTSPEEGAIALFAVGSSKRIAPFKTMGFSGDLVVYGIWFG